MPPPKTPVVTIQKTAKRYKAVRALAMLGMWVGGAYFLIVYFTTGETPPVATVILCLSLFGFIYAKVGAWWNHA